MAFSPDKINALELITAGEGFPYEAPDHFGSGKRLFSTAGMASSAIVLK